MDKLGISRGLAAAIALALSGCAIAPTEGQSLSSNNRVYFTGFAIEPSAGVRIQALNVVTSTWITLATGVADPEPYTITGIPFTRPLYDFRLDAVVPSAAWSANVAHVRAQTLWGGQWVPIWHYDSAGLTCIGERMADADSTHPLNVDLAGIECSRETNGGDDRYEVTVRRN